MRYYSYETYFPADAGLDTGRRASVEDWFETLSEAEGAMRTSLSVLPDGSTGTCYRRYADGDIGGPRRRFVKANGEVRKAK
jgi:hypothetical protein